MIKRAQLRQFLAVVDTGSFTRAAERIGVAQPSLSAGIAELERLVGAKLFLREQRRIRLTEAGSRLVAHARAIEREFRLAETGLVAAAPADAPLRIGALASLSTAMLGRIAAAYGRGRSLIVIEGSDADLRKRLAGGQIDAALTLLRAEDEDRGAALLAEEGYAMMLPADHALAAQAVLEAEAVAAETMIARRSCEILAETSRWFTRRGVRPPFFLRSANDDRCMEMVRVGMGITTAPLSLRRAGVVAVPLEGYDFRRRIGLVPARGQAELALPGHPLLEACREGAAAESS